MKEGMVGSRRKAHRKQIEFFWRANVSFEKPTENRDNFVDLLQEQTIAVEPF
jgi:hypothetical protein